MQQFQLFFDSVCRCFGHPTNGTGAGTGSTPVASTPANDTAGASPSQQSSAKRRTNRLGLQDKRWDELFEDGKLRQPKATPQAQQNKANNTDDMGEAHAVAEAKLAAQPGRQRSKRKRPKPTKEDIFRSKAAADQKQAAPNRTEPGGSSFTSFLYPTLAMCFASPVRGTEEEEPEEEELKSVPSASDTNTLNTCEDTVTSTVYYENKLSHMKETRPPMLLFHQFKLGQDKDEIRNIVANGSHSTKRLPKLVTQPNRRTPHQVVHLEGSSEESTEALRKKSSKRNCPDVEMEEVPDVKAVSTDSSKQSNTVR